MFYISVGLSVWIFCPPYLFFSLKFCFIVHQFLQGTIISLLEFWVAFCIGGSWNSNLLQQALVQQLL